MWHASKSSQLLPGEITGKKCPNIGQLKSSQTSISFLQMLDRLRPLRREIIFIPDLYVLDFSAILYLNEEFTGGQFIFARKNQTVEVLYHYSLFLLSLSPERTILDISRYWWSFQPDNLSRFDEVYRVLPALTPRNDSKECKREQRTHIKLGFIQDSCIVTLDQLRDDRHRRRDSFKLFTLSSRRS
jgi:hypothetical protein